MKQVSVRELKAHLSEYLRRAERGEDIQVARRNEPVARLTSIAAKREPLVPGVSWNGRQARGGCHRPRIAGKSVSERVLEDRG